MNVLLQNSQYSVNNKESFDSLLFLKQEHKLPIGILLLIKKKVYILYIKEAAESLFRLHPSSGWRLIVSPFILPAHDGYDCCWWREHRGLRLLPRLLHLLLAFDN